MMRICLDCGYTEEAYVFRPFLRFMLGLKPKCPRCKSQNTKKYAKAFSEEKKNE